MRLKKLHPKTEHAIHLKIQWINGLDKGRRLDEMVKLREQIQGEFNDELDEAFALVNLRDEKRPAREVASIRKTLAQICLPDEAKQLEMEWDDYTRRVKEYVDKECSMYEQKLLEIYMKEGSSRKVERSTGINRQSVMTAIKAVRAKIKKNVDGN